MSADDQRFNSGIFCISLDFELYYGVSDLVSLDRFRSRVEGARRAVPALLRLFEAYEVHASWATVGMLFADRREQIEAAVPAELRPRYDDPSLSNYRILDRVGDDEAHTPELLASSLIEQIRRVPSQEIATHTFSHFYTLEPGASLESFEADLRAAVAIAQQRGLATDSIVFPRNQYAPEHLEICRRVGLRAFRGNPPQWMHSPANSAQESALRRAMRLLDAHAPVAGSNNLYTPAHVRHPSGLANVPASRFLRPADGRTAMPGLAERRIRGELTRAAESGRLYHLWWHPHNFGGDLQVNLTLLEGVLHTFSQLRESDGMCSRSMSEVVAGVGFDEQGHSDRARQRTDETLLRDRVA